MIAATGHALEQALAYYRAPAMLSVARERRLPDDVLDVLRISAGDESLAGQGAASSGEPASVVVDAAVFYVQQVLFAPGADSYRVLGVNADAPDARIKEHYRWLVRWLHPDRNLDDWDSVYAERVNRAWQDLRLPERRAAYDAQRASGEALPAGGAAPAARPLGRLHANPTPAESLLSARTAQRLPAFVLGGLGLAAVSMLALMWYATVGQGPARPSASAPQAAETLAPDEMHAAMQAPPEAAEVPAAAAAVATTAPSPQGNERLPAFPEGAGLEATAGPDANAGLEATAGLDATAELGATPGLDAAPSAAAVRARPASQPSAPPSAPTMPTPAVEAPRTATASAPPRARPPSHRATRAPVAPSAAPSGSIAAVVAAPEPAAAEAVVPRVERAQAYGVLDQFSSAYAAGDINGLMRLFTRDARNNRGGRDAIVFDYQSLFSTTDQRELRFQPSGWMQGEPDRATLLASYQARVTVAGKRRPEASRGQIRFDLRREDGVLRISQIRLEHVD